MYAYIAGKLVEKQPTRTVVDVQGVGYELLVSIATCERLPEINKPVRLFVYYHVREDAAILYGFLTQLEKQVFEVMLSVSGIGPKIALATLSMMGPVDFRNHIIHGHEATLTRIPGVGRKTAQRMLLELPDRLNTIKWPRTDGSDLVPGFSETQTVLIDAIKALESLGYKPTVAERSVERVIRHHPEVQSTEDIIRFALKTR